MVLTPVRPEIRNLHFLSLVRRNGPSAFAKPGPAHPESEGPLLRPRRPAELHDPGPTGSGRNYVFRILGCFGWTSDRRLHINGTGKLRAGGEKDPVRHF